MVKYCIVLCILIQFYLDNGLLFMLQDMFTVFREMPRLEEARPGDGQHFSRSVREHLYSVINAVCFHSWAGLLLTK